MDLASFIQVVVFRKFFQSFKILEEVTAFSILCVPKSLIDFVQGEMIPHLQPDDFLPGYQFSRLQIKGLSQFPAGGMGGPFNVIVSIGLKRQVSLSP